MLLIFQVGIRLLDSYKCEEARFPDLDTVSEWCCVCVCVCVCVFHAGMWIMYRTV
jgi:hypothetical protein